MFVMCLKVDLHCMACSLFCLDLNIMLQHTCIGESAALIQCRMYSMRLDIDLARFIECCTYCTGSNIMRQCCHIVCTATLIACCRYSMRLRLRVAYVSMRQYNHIVCTEHEAME